MLAGRFLLNPLFRLIGRFGERDDEIVRRHPPPGVAAPGGGRDRQPGIAAVARAIYDRFADSTRSALTLFMSMH